MSRNDKPKKSKPPTFVRQVPKFLRDYSHLLTTNKKNYMGDEIGHQDEIFESAAAVEKDGAEIVNADSITDADCDDPPPAVETAESRAISNEPLAPKEKDLEYFKDGKIVFNAKPIDRTDRIAKRSVCSTAGATGGSAGVVKRHKKAKSNSLLSFDTEDDKC